MVLATHDDALAYIREKFQCLQTVAALQHHFAFSNHDNPGIAKLIAHFDVLAIDHG